MTELRELETTVCPLCADAGNTPFQSGTDLRYRLPGEFQIVRCARCRHRFTNPRPTFDGIRHYYPPDYAPHRSAPHSAGSAGANPSKAKRLMRRWPGLRRLVHWLVDSRAEYLPPVVVSPRRALELGCAEGRFLQVLKESGWEAQGVEISEAATQKARDRGLDVHLGPLETAAFSDACFDAVFAWMVIEHLHDPVATLTEVRRILKPWGWFLFSVPNGGSWEPRAFRRYWHAYDLPRHLQHFTPASLRQLLDRTGFDRIRIMHQRNVYNITGSLGLLFQDRLPGLSRRLLRFTDDPGIAGLVALAPLARLLAWIRQAGMLTVACRPR